MINNLVYCTGLEATPTRLRVSRKGSEHGRSHSATRFCRISFCEERRRRPCARHPLQLERCRGTLIFPFARSSITATLVMVLSNASGVPLRSIPIGGSKSILLRFIENLLHDFVLLPELDEVRLFHRDKLSAKRPQSKRYPRKILAQFGHAYFGGAANTFAQTEAIHGLCLWSGIMFSSRFPRCEKRPWRTVVFGITQMQRNPGIEHDHVWRSFP